MFFKKKKEFTPVTLYFNAVKIQFIDKSETIRAKRYDFSQFGQIIGGEGEGWELVAAGQNAIMNKPKGVDK